MSGNNRRHQRFAGTLTVQVAGDGTQRFGTIYEVSQGGAFLEVSPLPAVGATIDLAILREGRRMTLRAIVRYYASGLTGPRGMEGVGVEWFELAPPERALVDDMVSRAQAGKPLR